MIPKVIYIETTNLCNAKCIMCPHDKITRKPNIMDEKVFRKAVSDIVNLDLKGAQIFLHKEGEPLMDPDIMERLRYTASKLGACNEVGINTNAMLFTKEKAEEFLKTGANLIFFSVDGINKEEYERIRINLKFEVVEENIRYFLQMCNDKSRFDIRVVMQMLTEDDDDDRAEKFKKRWQGYPCEFYIKRMHGYLDGGHSSQTLELSEKQISYCEDPFRIMVIYTNGNTGLCCWDYNNEYSAGNIMEHDLSELYNGAAANKLREAIRKKRCSEIVPCNRCAKIFGSDRISDY